ncbi:SPRY domain-containing protein 7 [Silurus asotus]|uniref:SPRY domain-containing protein 7 n=1 Tax=Silurus asotus TaxID=30991 RepID=A0AAD5FMR6_SILAS|nr:SPRY domain-containing protein 7 [Silurus asotus]
MAAVFTRSTGCCCAAGGSDHKDLKEMSSVQLMGADVVVVVVVKIGRRICGSGVCLANAPLHQNKSYFKFRVQSRGVWEVGVGLTYDHVELNLYLNGKNMQCPASGIRGTVFPVVYVDKNAILDCQISDFYHIPPQGFEKILFEQQIF